MVILASEDVGMADPNGLVVADAAARAVEFVGMPEAQLNLAHAVIYLATAPKSNSVGLAMTKARDLVTDGPSPSVPPHLRSAAYPGAAKLGHGDGYRYAHDYEGGVVSQQYFPDGVPPTALYRPGSRGAEEEIKDRLAGIDRILGRERAE
jgi:putative ATPase